MEHVDYLVVGAGLFGAVFAHEARKAGKSVMVIDRRPQVAGNVYTEEVEGINVHKYGAHIFHTNNKEVWDYVGQFAEFNRYTNSPVANYHGELYSLPFNMYTFNKMWGVVTPKEAEERIAQQREEAGITEPKNLEEQAISLVGTDIYEKLVKGYTQKQWGRPCTELPSFIIKRLPVRLTFDNNYFNALYQGIPMGGYTKMVERMLEGIEVKLDTDFLKDREKWNAMADKIVYTGAIDEFFDFSLGNLEFRSVRFETEVLDMPNFQGNAVINYTDAETPYTRIIEHKFFEFGTQEKTVISREYSSEWKPGDEPYYPVNDEKNGTLYEQYRALAEKEEIVKLECNLDDMTGEALGYAAEKLRQYGIPFRYEATTGIPDLPYVPDFMIKRPRDGKIFYWEHFGDVNDEKYMKRNGRKLERYEEYGIVPWDNLIITYDFQDGGVNVPLIDGMIHAWLI